MDLKGAIKDLVILAVGLLTNVVFETIGIALSALNSAVANMSSYVSTSSLAATVSILIPVANIVSMVGGIWILLEIFGADKFITFG